MPASNPLIDVIRQAAEDECAKPFCKQCGGQRFKSLLRRIERKKTGLHEALCEISPQDLTSLPNWAEALQVAMRRLGERASSVLQAWLPKVGHDIRFEDVVLFRFVRQQARASDIRRRWIAALVPRALETRDSSLVESLVLVLQHERREYPALEQLARDLAETDPQVRRALQAEFGPPSIDVPWGLVGLLARNPVRGGATRLGEGRANDLVRPSFPVISDLDMMRCLERVGALLGDCHLPERRMPATELFNEGWMLRLVLDWAERHPDAVRELRFLPGSRWFSEARLQSPFRRRRRVDLAAEGFTHADAVIGHLDMGSYGHSGVRLRSDARQLTIVEAKMASLLSAGTKYAPDYNQAARNVACLVKAVEGLDPSVLELSFVVLAPRKRLALFEEQLNLEAICRAVRERAETYDAGEPEATAAAWWRDQFMPVVQRCLIRPLAWEVVLDQIGTVDADGAESLRAFYAQCLQFNPFPPAPRSLGLATT